MNQLLILITGIVSISTALTAIGILNYVDAQDNTTALTGNMTKGNATVPMGNDTDATGIGATGTGNVKADIQDDIVGHISRRSR